MEERIIEFAGVLRRNGIRVSLSENMDAFRALELIGIRDPLLFRNALRTTLVKRVGDLKPFDELFDFYFLGIGQALDALDRRIMEELGLTPEQFQEMLEQIQRLLKEMEVDLSELTKALLSNNRGEIERFKAMLQMLGETGEDLQKAMRYLDERMRDLNRLLREIIQQEQRKKGFEPRDSSQ